SFCFSLSFIPYVGVLLLMIHWRYLEVAKELYNLRDVRVTNRRELNKIRNIPIKYFRLIHVLGKFVGVVFILYGIVLLLQGLSFTLFRMIPLIIGFSIGGFIFYTGERAGKFIESGKRDVAAIDQMC